MLHTMEYTITLSCDATSHHRCDITPSRDAIRHHSISLSQSRWNAMPSHSISDITLEGTAIPLHLAMEYNSVLYSAERYISNEVCTLQCSIEYTIVFHCEVEWYRSPSIVHYRVHTALQSTLQCDITLPQWNARPLYNIKVIMLRACRKGMPGREVKRYMGEAYLRCRVCCNVCCSVCCNVCCSVCCNVCCNMCGR